MTIREGRIGQVGRAPQKPMHEAFSIPPSTGGLSLLNNIAMSPAGTALILENYYPTTSNLRARRGSAKFITGLPQYSVKSLIAYQNGANDKHFAFTNGRIYDVTTGGNSPLPAWPSLGNDFVSHTNFTQSGGVFLYVVNGTNPPIYYDGTAWVQPAITFAPSSPAPSTSMSAFGSVCAHAARLYFTEKGSMRLWFLGTDNIQGVATSIELSSSCQEGGEFVAVASTGMNAGDGVQSYICAMTSEGELVVYQGIDPTNASTWQEKGTYRIGKPMGKKCFLRVQGELLIMTEDGIVSFNSVVQLDRAAVIEKALTRNILPIWRDLVRKYGGIEGWSMSYWPLEGMLIVNYPTLGETPRQMIMNVNSGAWSIYSGWNAKSFNVFNNRLFFAADSGVMYEGEVGASDDGTPYECRWMAAYSDFGKGFAHKHIKLARPSIRSNMRVKCSMLVRRDYEEPYNGAIGELPQPAIGGVWNVHNWNEFFWGGGLIAQGAWRTVHGEGSAIALDTCILIDGTQDGIVEVNRLDIQFTTGGLTQ